MMRSLVSRIISSSTFSNSSIDRTLTTTRPNSTREATVFKLLQAQIEHLLLCCLPNRRATDRRHSNGSRCKGSRLSREPLAFRRKKAIEFDLLTLPDGFAYKHNPFGKRGGGKAARPLQHRAELFTRLEREIARSPHFSFHKHDTRRTHLGSDHDLVHPLQRNIFCFFVIEQIFWTEGDDFGFVCERVCADDFSLVYIGIDRKLIGFEDIAHSHAWTELVGSWIFHRTRQGHDIHHLRRQRGDTKEIPILECRLRPIAGRTLLSTQIEHLAQIDIEHDAAFFRSSRNNWHR